MAVSPSIIPIRIMTVSPVGAHYAGEMKEVNSENLQLLKSG
jgi:hypothetical protein